MREVEGMQRRAGVGREKSGAEVVIRVANQLPTNGANPSVAVAGWVTLRPPRSPSPVGLHRQVPQDRVTGHERRSRVALALPHRRPLDGVQVVLGDVLLEDGVERGLVLLPEVRLAALVALEPRLEPVRSGCPALGLDPVELDERLGRDGFSTWAATSKPRRRVLGGGCRTQFGFGLEKLTRGRCGPAQHAESRAGGNRSVLLELSELLGDRKRCLPISAQRHVLRLHPPDGLVKVFCLAVMIVRRNGLRLGVKLWGEGQRVGERLKLLKP